MGANADRLRALFDAFGKRDFEVLMTAVAPDVELRPAVTEMDLGECYRGPGEVRRFFEIISEGWEEFWIEPLEMTEVDDRVIVVERWHVRGRQGIEFDFELTDVYTFDQGLVIKIQGFRDKAEALA